MFLVKTWSNFNSRRHKLLFDIAKYNVKRCITHSRIYDETFINDSKKEDDLETLISKYESKILYNSTIESKHMRFGYKKNNIVMIKKVRNAEKIKSDLASVQPIPLSLKYLLEATDIDKFKEKEEKIVEPEQHTHFPYNHDCTSVQNSTDSTDENTNDDKINNFDSEIRSRHEIYKNMKDWMKSYDNFENDILSEDDEEFGWKINYGTPDPNAKISNVPCGGCGALLHCKDSAIPGYIPSEIFKNCWKNGAANLEAIICQRCYFLKEYNLALQVRVSPEDYPKILTTIQGKKALVVLLVDLMDFPCSIWPGIADILGPKTPIVVVGNKIDLLPKDDTKFLNRIRQNLLDHMKIHGFGSSKILHVGLISAKTGFGIEDLITVLQFLWKYKDAYLVGCTNVGKSSLFNALLQSDYCKIQAVDLIQRATTSLWPGTTLNLLKFPITRPTGHRVYLRHQRLMALQKIAAEEKRLRNEQSNITKSVKYATLIGHIGRTPFKEEDTEEELNDCFSVRGYPNASGKLKMGINEKHPDFALSHWCFDTPGVVQPDQILHLLTTEELMFTLPKQLIRPETFSIRAGTSLFIAGLARLDYLEGPDSIRLTVFRSNELPITICPLSEANNVYQEFLGTELFKVPVNIGDRLLKWPNLKSTAPFLITGTEWKLSSNDVVLSSTGWVAINCTPDKQYKFQAWTPEGRGIFVRDCLLPKAVTLRGAKIRYSVAYKEHRFIY